MIHSIRQFCQNGAQRLTDIFSNYTSDLTRIAEMMYGVTDEVTKLRIYRQNQGNMLELVRYQKKERKRVAGAEEIIYTATDMIRMKKANQKKLGALADLPVSSIPYPQIKKIAALKNHIWGL